MAGQSASSRLKDNNRAVRRRKRRLICETLENRLVLSATISNNIGVGNQLQNYRIAIAATAEYTTLLGGQTQAFDAIQTFVSDLNAIFEDELSIHFNLVSGLNTVFTDSATDGYTNGSTSAMLDQNTGVLNAVLGNSAYDIGHVFGTATSGGAGLAGLGVVNNSTRKGEGASISTNPQGADWVKLVAHEIGHQFNAEHSFNANAFASAAGNRSGTNAYEPASGTTLMSYAGISGADDLQDDPDAYFHASSFESIQTFVASSAPPNSLSPSGNNIPTVSGGPDYIIPAGTPFQLTAAGSDPDSGDVLTYTWEQLDLGPAMSLPIFDNGSSPLFRSFPPTPNPTRSFPRLSDLVNNVNTAQLGEALPTTNRNLNFRATVRDGAGGIHSDDVLLTVVNTGIPFAVTSPNTSVTWTGGTTQTITWNTGKTDPAADPANGISVANVGIDLSLDGGLTYPVTLLSSTPNDGSETITVPNLAAGEARIRLRALGNIFYDLSNTNFTILADAASAGLSINETNGSTLVGEDGLLGSSPIDTYTITLNTVPSSPVDVTVSADSQTEVSLDGTTFSPAVTVTLADRAPLTIYVRGFDDTIQEGIHSGLITHSITASSDPSYPVGPIGNPVSVTIADDELQPVIGVDFDQVGGTTPQSWTKISSIGTFNNLIREDGLVSGVGLTFAISGGSAPNGSNLSTAPLHTPSLQTLGGNYIAANSMTLTWTGLTPDADYNVYLMTGENFSLDVFQQVTITGGTNPTPFTQDTRGLGNVMLVNSNIADAGKRLESDAVTVQADSTGQIQVLVDNLLTTDFAILAGAAIQQSSPPPPALTLSIDPTAISENGGSATATLTRNTGTAGDLTVILSSSDPGEAIVPASIVIPDQSDSVSFTILGVDDAILDGTQTVTITASATDYQPANQTLDVTDDETPLLGPLVGIDFDFSTTASPTNWTPVGSRSTPATLSNLIGEDGISTAIDLSVDAAGGGVFATNASVNPATIPSHSQSLSLIDGQIYTNNNNVTFTWRDLTPGTSYEIYVFGLEPVFQPITQNVTITGAGTPITFLQSFTVGQLFVNDRLGSSSEDLSSFAQIATANASGEIIVQVDRFGSTQDVSFGGLAIREIVSAPAIQAELSVTTDGAENGPVDVVFTVTLNQINDTGSPITFDLDDLMTGTATSIDDYAAIAPGAKVLILAGESSGSISIPVINDSFVEAPETLVAQISNPSLSSISILSSTATATINDNDVSTVNISVDPESILEDAEGAVTFRLTRDNTNSSTPELTVAIHTLGTATLGIDYSISDAATVTFAPGSDTATITVAPSSDSVIEPDESVAVMIAESDDYLVGVNNEAVARILNDDPGGLTTQVFSIVYFNQDAEQELGFSPEGTGQRSIIRRVRVTFSGAVSVPLGAVVDDSFRIETTGGLSAGTRVGLEVVSSELVAGQQVVVLKFTGTDMIEPISRKKRSVDAMLVDGAYQLTINGAALGIDANGAAFGVNATDDFFRLFGDTDGDRDVDGTDHERFFDFYDNDNGNALFDFDGRQEKKAVDRAEFVRRYGQLT